MGGLEMDLGKTRCEGVDWIKLAQYRPNSGIL
jgi:hypothetical protein